MGKRRKSQQGKQVRQVRVRDVRRHPPDLKKLAGALIALAQAQAETDAAAEHARQQAADRAKHQRDEQPPTGDAA